MAHRLLTRTSVATLVRFTVQVHVRIPLPVAYTSRQMNRYVAIALRTIFWIHRNESASSAQSCRTCPTLPTVCRAFRNRTAPSLNVRSVLRAFYYTKMVETCMMWTATPNRASRNTKIVSTSTTGTSAYGALLGTTCYKAIARRSKRLLRSA